MTNIPSLHIEYFHFNLDRPDEAAAYQAFLPRLTDSDPTTFIIDNLDFRRKVEALHSTDAPVDTDFLFPDQWNTTSPTNLRLHHAVLYSCPNKSIKTGYLATPNSALNELLTSTYVCGYCGHQHKPTDSPQPPPAFHEDCLESPNLSQSNLYLTRFLPVSKTDEQRLPLTPTEEAYLLPLYKHAQFHGVTERGVQRLKQQRADLLEKKTRAQANAQTEYDGMVFILDKLQLPIDNVIYYNHTQTFCFGWRHPLDSDELSNLLDVISEFPYPYEIERKGGGKLSAT